MINDWLEAPYNTVGTVLKETHPDYNIGYYIVGEHFIYCNDYDYPEIRPHKFIFDEYVSVASENEKKQFIEDLKKNHLIWNEETGKLIREFEEFQFSVKIRCEYVAYPEDILNKLNNVDWTIEGKDISSEIINMKFEDF